MKTKLLTIFLALTGAFMAEANVLPLDWDNIDSSYVYTCSRPTNTEYKALKSMKAACDKNYLYIRTAFDTLYLNIYEDCSIEDHHGAVPFHVFLNNETNNGHRMMWNAPSPLMAEGLLFESGRPASAYTPQTFIWEGDKPSGAWLWSEYLNQIVTESIITDSTIEMQISLSNLPFICDGYIYVGVEIEKDWDHVGILPRGEDTEDPKTGAIIPGKTETAKVKIVPTLINHQELVINHLGYNIDKDTKTASIIYCEKDITNIEIPDTIEYNGDIYSVTTIWYETFSGCTGLTSIDVDADNTHYCSIDGVLFNYAKDTLIQYPVGNSRTEYTIPYSVTTIGRNAFSSCINLTSVTIPNSITTIGHDAFSSCSNLASVTIPNSVTMIGNNAFHSCSNLASVTIPNSVTMIGNNAFQSCNGLTLVSINSNAITNQSYSIDYNLTVIFGEQVSKYVLGNSITSIGDDAFYNCTGLTSVTIPNSVTTIEYGAFWSCRGLTSVTIPNSVTTIGDWAFANCSGLTSITIPNSVTTIGDCAFRGCTSLPIIDNLRYAGTYLIEAVDKRLSTYTIKDGTKWIGSNAFSDCRSLTSVTIPNSVTTIGDGAFYGCSGLTSVTIPNSVTTIGGAAFTYCSGLTSVTIPNSVTTIREEAFWGCSSLTSVTIPNSVTTIGDWAFYGCKGLTSVTVHWTNEKELPIMGYNVFNNIADRVGPSAATLHVPAGTKSIYQTAEQWEEFGTIVSDTPTPLPNVLMNDTQCTMHKVLRNGQLLIETNNATYTPTGQKVK